MPGIKNPQLNASGVGHASRSCAASTCLSKETLLRGSGRSPVCVHLSGCTREMAIPAFYWGTVRDVVRMHPDRRCLNDKLSLVKSAFRTELGNIKAIWTTHVDTVQDGRSSMRPRPFSAIFRRRLGSSDSSGADSVEPTRRERLPGSSIYGRRWTPHSPRSVLQAIVPDENVQQGRVEILLLQAFPSFSDLKQASWKGCSFRTRPTVWRLLLQYEPLEFRLRAGVLQKKRGDYGRLVRSTNIPKPGSNPSNSALTEAQHALLRQIDLDLPRTHALTQLFRSREVQALMRRVLYVFGLKNETIGYVQGMNEIITPLVVVFLSEHLCSTCNIEDLHDLLNLETVDKLISGTQMACVEADVYWCFTSIIHDIADNFLPDQSGIQEKVALMEEILAVEDPELAAHFQREGCDALHYSFRWFAVLLLREFRLPLIFRLWDSMLAEPNGFNSFLAYACVALLVNWREELLQMDFSSMLSLLLNMPTGGWSLADIDILLSQAMLWVDANKRESSTW